MQTLAYALLLATQAAPATAPLKPAPSISEDTARWWIEYPTGVRTMSIGSGRSLELFCQGKGSPTVILENGLGNRMIGWWKVQPVLARRYRVCAYNRAGLGGSSFGPTPRDAVAIVSDLEKLVRRAQLRPPYILVGFSMGGLTMRLFARRNLHRIAGIVLVDPSSEDQDQRWARIRPQMLDDYRADLDRYRWCMAHVESAECRASLSSAVPAALRDRLAVRRPTEWQTMVSELESLGPDGQDSAQIKSAGTDLKAIPLIVLTADTDFNEAEIPEAQRTALQGAKIAMHRATARSSRRGVQRIVAGSTHDMLRDRPDAVFEAVDEVAAMARRSR